VKKMLLMVAMLAAFAPIGANAGHNGRVVTGTVTLPSANDGSQTVTRQARCAATLNLPNDVVGHVEYLDADEGDGSHEFTLSGAADWDIVFYVSLGTCDTNAVGTTSFATAGDESGTIPEGATAAIAVFRAPGANESFTLSIS
jgi:hypothetical protein